MALSGYKASRSPWLTATFPEEGPPAGVRSVRAGPRRQAERAGEPSRTGKRNDVVIGHPADHDASYTNGFDG